MTTPPPDTRYHRQMLLPEIGAEGQRRLAAAHAAVIGCGALGTVIADLLVRAGVGIVTIADRDVVERTNLQRQTLFTERDAAEGAPKAIAAARALEQINSDVTVRALVTDVSHRSVRQVCCPGSDVPDAGVIVDGTDNFETRYLLNDLAISAGTPYVYGGAVGTEGLTMTIIPPACGEAASPCLRCVFEEPPASGSTPTCDTAGVLGPVTALVASIEAAEAMKCLLGRWDRVSRDLLSVDPWTGRFQRIDLRDARRADCPCCGQGRMPWLAGERSSPAVSLCGRGAVQVVGPTAVDLRALAVRLGDVGSFVVNEHVVRGVLPGEPSEDAGAAGVELTVFADGRAIVKGTSQVERARGIIARYVGT